MNRPPQPAGGGRRHRRTGLAGNGLPPLAALTLRFADGQCVEIHCRPRPNGMLAVHTAHHADRAEQEESAEVVHLARASFLTITGRRGSTAATISMLTGADFDTAATAADTLDLLSGAVLTVAGVTQPDDARAILTTLWIPP